MQLEATRKHIWNATGRCDPVHCGVTTEFAAVPAYCAPVWLAGGHAQTIYPFLLPRASIRYRRERVDAPDSDFWDLDWLDAEPAASTPIANPASPVVVLFHGLEGGSRSHYALALMSRLASMGWRGVVPHFRGCGGEPNRHPRAYHSGDYEEIDAMLVTIHRRVRAVTPEAPLYAVGVSLGGSALLNWLGRAGRDASRLITAAAAVSAPIDLTAAGIAIGEGLNRVYSYHFLWTLRPKSMAMAQRFPGLLEPDRLRRVRSMYDFDDAVTAPLHGFDGAADYWYRASSKPWLRHIGIPTLVLNARNDPFVPGASLPGSTEVAQDVLLEQPQHGGHAGFLTNPFPGNLQWLPQRLIQFFRNRH
jgi:predicted alpha/beta-fold hydrolase